MRDNNNTARDFLIRQGYQDIWLKPHTRYKDWVWSHGEYDKNGKFRVIKYTTMDLWNLFDGMCWKDGKLHFLAISNKFKKITETEQFIRNKTGFSVLMIKVTNNQIDIKGWSK